MTTSRTTKAAVSIFLAVCLLGPGTQAYSDEVEGISSLPAAIQKVVKSEFPGARVTEIEDGEFDETPVYEITGTSAEGTEFELEIGKDGKLYQKDENIGLEVIEPTVLATLKKQLGNNPPKTWKRMTEYGKVYYEITGQSEGKEIELKIAVDGGILEREVDGQKEKIASSPGLIGIQYGSGDLERAQNFVKLATLNQQWSGKDNFGSEWSGRWFGSVVGPTDGTVRFKVVSAQDAIVEVGGKAIVDTRKGVQSGQIEMVRGKAVPIVLTYFKGGNGSDCGLKVLWDWTGSQPAPIGAKNLTHTTLDATKVARLYKAAQDDEADDDEDEEEGPIPVGDEPVFRDAKGIVFQKRAGQMHIGIDGKLFATYVWSDSRTTRPYFKQIHALGGEVQLTRNHPPQRGDISDHETYHPGIWWGFGDVGGNDYWRMKAKVIGGTFLEEPKGDENQGSFTVRNRLLTNDGSETFCYQVCRYTILRRSNGILLITESTLTRPDSDFWLGDQEEMGLAIRVATPLATKSDQGGVIRDSKGRTKHEQIRTNQSDWCDYSGPIAGKHGGILLMNDPANFRKPWWHAVDTGLLIANPLGESELNGRGKKRENVLVEKGKPFRLRYGAFLHLNDNAKEFDPAVAYKDFLKVLPTLGRPKDPGARTDLPRVPEGFEISIFAQEPRVYKPSAICFDSKGRLMVGQGPQYPKNLRSTPTDSVVLLIDSDHDGVADETKTFATGFNSVQGLAWKGNDLYVANAPELTIVRDLDGDDEADEYVVVYTDLGNREHALHGLNFAPDGKLYMSKGNSKGHNQPEKYGYVAPRPFRELWDVVHPPGAPDSYPPKSYTKHDYKKTYHHWDDDWGREGGVLRCDPLGAKLEIVSRGMRNPWDITMDDGFNWLGTDNDQDQGDRIMMPFFGAHFGWGHPYSSHWTGENHLPTAPMSGPVFPGSGTGTIFYAHRQFPPHYRNVFFINDWMHGTFLYRPVWDGSLLQPAGGRWEPFASRADGGMLYRPTDLEFSPDGSLYICGWGGDYHYGRQKEGSWMFRISHAGSDAEAHADRPAQKRQKAYAEWSVGELVDDLGPDAIPVWRVNAQDELVRRGPAVREALVKAIGSGKLNRGQQTWALWAIGRAAPEDRSVDEFLARLAAWDASSAQRVPLNVRIQALRILAHRVRDHAPRDLPASVAATLQDPEPRVRLEAVQAIWQGGQTKSLPALLDRLPDETDRLVFYAGWHALRELAPLAQRKQLLTDKRPAVRLAALLSLLEGHELALDQVLAFAEGDPDSRIQHWAMTWAMNPRPPKKMPNTTSRIELEKSVEMRDLIGRAKDAKSAKLRRLYLSMISHAYGDWGEIRDFYRTLQSDDERALVLKPLARENNARPHLWQALAGTEALQQAAIRGFVSLSNRSGNSPEKIADFLLAEAAEEPAGRRLSGSIEALARLSLPDRWRPQSGWDAPLARAFANSETSALLSKVLSVLLVIDPALVGTGTQTKAELEAASRNPDPILYASLLAINPRLGITLKMKPPEKATIDGVLAKLPTADVERGRELFFSRGGLTSCAACHRLSGRGNNLGPDLSGIGLRSEAKTIVQSILEPSATITEGYQLQTFVLKDGSTLAGAVLRESDAEIRLAKIDGTLEMIDRQSIRSRSKSSISTMPSGFELLGNEQIADLVKFLAGRQESVRGR